MPPIDAAADAVVVFASSRDILYQRASLQDVQKQDAAMKRRDLLALLGGAALVGPRVTLAQTPGRIYHLGTLHPAAPMTETSPFGKILVKALADRGYILGKT